MDCRNAAGLRCPLCGGPMKRNGHDPSGRQRRYCPACRAGRSIRRPARALRAQLEQFLSRLLGGGGQGPASDAGASRRHTSWCWDLQPYIVPDGRAHPVVTADGTYVGHGRCLLVVCDGLAGNVLAWRWCRREDSTDHAALFRLIARLYGIPRLLVSDGMRGIPAAARAAWPGCALQRRLEHVRRDCRTDLTLRPRTQAGRELKRIAGLLARTRDTGPARLFLQALNAWHTRWGGCIREKTWNRHGRPGCDPAGPVFWWTHQRVGRCYMRLQRLAGSGELFRFLDPALAGLGPLPCTSNRLGGGINSPLKRMLLDRRGMPERHMLRACEWVCWKRGGRPLPPITRMLPQQTRHPDTADDDGTPGWGTAPEWTDLHTETRYPYTTD